MQVTALFLNVVTIRFWSQFKTWVGIRRKMFMDLDPYSAQQTSMDLSPPATPSVRLFARPLHRAGCTRKPLNRKSKKKMLKNMFGTFSGWLWHQRGAGKPQTQYPKKQQLSAKFGAVLLELRMLLHSNCYQAEAIHVSWQHIQPRIFHDVKT